MSNNSRPTYYTYFNNYYSNKDLDSRNITRYNILILKLFYHYKKLIPTKSNYKILYCFIMQN